MFGFYLVKFSLEGCCAFELRIERLLHRIDHFFETFDALGVSGRRAVAADQGGRTSEGTLFGGVPAETQRTLDRGMREEYRALATVAVQCCTRGLTASPIAYRGDVCN